MNAFEKIIAILVACILMFIYPIYSMSLKTNNVVETYVDDQTANLVDTIRSTGKLTYDMYTMYTKMLTNTANVYDISITHQHAIYYPVYDDAGVATGDVELKYENVYEGDILDEIYNGSGEYKFTEGDYVSIKIKNTNRTMSDMIEEVILKNPQGSTPRIYVSHGGRIRDET